MKKILPLVLLALGATGLAFAALRPQPTVAATGPCGTSHDDVSSGEQQLFSLVNSWRAANLGAPPMQLSVPVNKAAQWFAEAMVAETTSGHLDEYGRTWVDRLKDCGYSAYWAGGSGEALAGFGSSDPSYGSTPQQALDMMTQSTPGHMNGVQAPVSWQCGGVGYAANSSPAFGQLRYAWVVVVAQYGSSTCPQAVPGGGTTTTASPTSTSPTPTKTPTPTPTPHRAYAPLLSRDN